MELPNGLDTAEMDVIDWFCDWFYLIGLFVYYDSDL